MFVPVMKLYFYKSVVTLIQPFDSTGARQGLELARCGSSISRADDRAKGLLLFVQLEITSNRFK